MLAFRSAVAIMGEHFEPALIADVEVARANRWSGYLLEWIPFRGQSWALVARSGYV
jgi:hypothetical protein